MNKHRLDIKEYNNYSDKLSFLSKCMVFELRPPGHESTMLPFCHQQFIDFRVLCNLYKSLPKLEVTKYRDNVVIGFQHLRKIIGAIN